MRASIVGAISKYRYNGLSLIAIDGSRYIYTTDKSHLRFNEKEISDK